MKDKCSEWKSNLTFFEWIVNHYSQIRIVNIILPMMWSSRNEWIWMYLVKNVVQKTVHKHWIKSSDIMCVFELKWEFRKSGKKNEKELETKSNDDVKNVSWMAVFCVCVCVFVESAIERPYSRTWWLSSKNNFVELFTFEIYLYRRIVDFYPIVELTYWYFLPFFLFFSLHLSLYLCGSPHFYAIWGFILFHFLSERLAWDVCCSHNANTFV